MKSHKKQHWVPRSYLNAWCDPETPDGQEPYVWVFPKEGGVGRRRAPRNLFTETDLYTIPRQDGSRDLTLEHGLAELESLFAGVREAVRERHPLAPEDQLVLRAFMAAAFVRTRMQRDHWREQWRGVLEDVELIKQAAERATPAERKAMGSVLPPGGRGPTMGIEEVRALAEQPLQRTLATAIDTQLRIMAGMNVAILCTDDDPGFITSDAPCVWFDPEWHKKPLFFRAPGLATKTIEITLPIAPDRLALLTWGEVPRDLYVGVSSMVVDHLNRRTRFHCGAEFVVRRNVTEPVWFDPGRPPDL